MGENRDQLNKRRRARRAQQKARARRRRMALRLLAAVMVLGVSAAAIWLLVRTFSDGDGPTEPSSESVSQTRPAEVQTEDSADTTVIHLAAAGDIMVTDKTVKAGKSGKTYDYTDVFMDVLPVLAGADLTVANFEGNLLGKPYGTETTSAPVQMAEALKDAGVDLVQMANSTVISDGIAGLKTSLAALRETGLEPLGAYADSQEYEKYKGYTIVDVQGIRIAFAAFTKGMGGLSLPAGSEDCVNLLYTDYATTYKEIDKDGIAEVLANVAKEKPDLTIALVHWGSEYMDQVTDGQKKIAKIMKENGADVVLGTHSHLLHEIEYDELTGQMVAYSLGDLFGDGERAGTDYSVILDLEITRDNNSGDTKVTNYSYTPIYILTKNTAPDGQHRVVQLDKAVDAYEDNFVDRVSEDVYNDMTHALSRIPERINPPKEEEEKK